MSFCGIVRTFIRTDIFLLILAWVGSLDSTSTYSRIGRSGTSGAVCAYSSLLYYIYSDYIDVASIWGHACCDYSDLCVERSVSEIHTTRSISCRLPAYPTLNKHSHPSPLFPKTRVGTASQRSHFSSPGTFGDVHYYMIGDERSGFGHPDDANYGS